MTFDTDDPLKRAGELLRRSRNMLDEGEYDPSPEALDDWMSEWSKLRPQLAIGSLLVKQLDIAASHISSLQS